MKLLNLYLILSLICISFQLFAKTEAENKYKKIGDYYKWNDRESAVKFYLDDEKEAYLPPEKNTKKYADAIAITDEIYEGYIKILGLENKREKIPKPLIVWVQNSKSGSSSGSFEFPDGTRAQTNAIILDTAQINTKKSAYAIIAHELSHFFMKDGMNEDFEDELKYVHLTTDNKDDCIECTETPDSIEIKDTLIDLVEILEITGGHNLPELNHIPFDVYIKGSYSSKMFKDMLKRRDKTSKNCIEVNDLYEDMGNILVRSYSDYDQELHLTIKDRVELIRLTLHIHDIAPHCFKEMDKDKSEILESVLDLDGTTPRDIIDYFVDDLEDLEELSEYDHKSFDILTGDLSIFDTIVAFQQNSESERGEMESDLGSNFDRIRFITEEDIADMNAVKVLNLIGKEKDSVEAMLINLIKNESEQKKCQKHIEQGIEPPYGIFTDSHHANCWRAFRANRFRKKIEQGNTIK